MDGAGSWSDALATLVVIPILAGGALAYFSFSYFFGCFPSEDPTLQS